MSKRSWIFGAAAIVAATLPAVAAQLHFPLPPDSTARNGVKQTLDGHFIGAKTVSVALPDSPLHPDAKAGLHKRYSGTPIDVLNYHYDAYPTGWNQSETDLTPATVGSSSFGKIATLQVDGNVMAQPLMVSNFTMPDSSVHNVLIVATGHDTVYAYDAQTYDILWKRTLGKAQATNDVGCGDIHPEYGISSTPVIVRNGASSATIYLVAATEPKSFSFHTQLRALDLGTGKDIMKAREIAPAGKLASGGKIHFDPQNQWSRASLAYKDGSLYVGIGSHCDSNAGAISGWMLRYDTASLKLTGKFNTIQTQASYELSSIWMAGYAPAIDPDGNVFAVTGNGYYNQSKGAKGYGESVLSLSSDLKKVVGTFTPSNWQSLNNGDADFGSGGVMLIPTVSGQTAPPMAVAAGKAGSYYLLNASKLGGLQGGSAQPLQTIALGACWCGSAYYVGPSGGVVFYQGGNDGIRSFGVSTGSNPQLTPIATGNSGAGGTGTFPIVSTNGSTPNTGVVWVIHRGNPTESLEAYDAVKLGAPLYSATAGNWSNGSRSYLSPLVANGRVYVGSATTLTVFGLTN